MGAVRTQRMIAAPVETVWARIADTGAIADWFPAFVGSSMESPRHRRIRLASGLHLEEEIVSCDPVTKQLHYRIVGGLPILRAHSATVTVTAVDSGSLVSYTTDVEPAALSFILGGAIDEALAELERQLTGGT